MDRQGAFCSTPAVWPVHTDTGDTQVLSHVRRCSLLLQDVMDLQVLMAALRHWVGLGGDACRRGKHAGSAGCAGAQTGPQVQPMPLTWCLAC